MNKNMRKLRQIFASFMTSEDFNDISPDGKSAEIEIGFCGDSEYDKFKKALKDSLVEATILYESPRLGKWYSAGTETKYVHLPYIDLEISKQNWLAFIEFYKDFIYNNGYVSSPKVVSQTRQD